MQPITQMITQGYHLGAPSQEAEQIKAKALLYHEDCRMLWKAPFPETNTGAGLLNTLFTTRFLKKTDRFALAID